MPFVEIVALVSVKVNPLRPKSTLGKILFALKAEEYSERVLLRIHGPRG
jgi:hypothetical protein